MMCEAIGWSLVFMVVFSLGMLLGYKANEKDNEEQRR
jgi:hypothetical protein